MNIKNFMPGGQKLAVKALCLGGGLLVSAVFFAGSAEAQFNFAGAQVLSGDSGTQTNDNTLATVDMGAPTIAGNFAHAPLWYQWTASHDGEVELDTVGSGYNLDTVLGVYTGSDLGHLNQIAANDDLYPVSSLGIDLISPFPETGDDVILFEPYPTNTLQGIEFGTQGYYGPSHLRFNAVGGQTYYFAADTKLTANFLAWTGNIQLNWAYKSSGVFRFASEDFDPLTGFPLFQTAQTESVSPRGNGNADVSSAIQTYYTYNASGLLVTVTRTAGSKGRVSVDYYTVDGAQSAHDVGAYTIYTNISQYVDTNGQPFPGPTGLPFVTNIVVGDYSPVQGTLIFDDFEMSKTILLPINSSGGYLSNPAVTTYEAFPTKTRTNYLALNSPRNTDFNATFSIVLTNAQVDPLEASDLAAPRIDPVFGNATVRILNANADPYGPNLVPVVSTNGYADAPTNNVPNLLTNYVMALYPTNNVFNFEKVNYRVPADLTDPAIKPYGYANIAIYVERFGTNTSAETINYRIDSELDDDGTAKEGNNLFPLQPGSDYAVPLPANQNTTVRDYTTDVYDRVTTNYDFDGVEGTLSFPSGTSAAATAQPIHINIPISKATKFNKDFRLQLYREVKIGNDNVPEMTGMNSETTITILFNDENPPAGSVDEFYNPDFFSEMSILPAATRIPDRSNPGVGSPLFPGQVYGIATLTNDEALIGGDFSTYNGTTRNGVALVDQGGQLDPSFNPAGGAGGDITGQNGDAKVYAVATWGNQFYVAGNFTAFDGSGAGAVARINLDGSLDTAFSFGNARGGNTGANGLVRAMAVLQNGEVVVGGDFTQINGLPCNYIALVNTNGDVDTSFNAGNLLNGPVYSLALPPSVNINLASTASGGSNEVDTPINLGAANAATLTVNYDMLGQPDDMRVFYGATNGTLIYDTGLVSYTGGFVLPFGPTNGVSTNLITIVMDQGGGQVGTLWSYTASIVAGPTNLEVLVGGNFAITGQTFQNVAQLKADGSLDPAFHPLTGANGIVHTLAWQPDGRIIAGGEFNSVNGATYNHIARFNADGSLDTTNFFVGTGADDVVYNANLQLDGTIYIGGAFQTFNGTRRSGFARLYANGTVDTTFMDTAYNQFAGIKKIYSDDPLAVFASAVQSDNGVLIGGSFLQVGGGQADPEICNTLDEELSAFGYIPDSFGDPHLWVEPKTRDGVRNRTGFARLIGGATPGPGNISFSASTYSQNKSISTEPVSLIRTNGFLGPISANFSVLPGTALGGQDYQYQGAPPLFWVAWEYLSHPSRQREDGLAGASGSLVDPLGLSLPRSDTAVNTLSTVTVGVKPDSSNPGNLNAQFQLANPSLAETFYLGGEPIPLGTALGTASAQFNLIDDTTYSGQFGFIAPTFIATNGVAVLTLVRSNGTFGQFSMLLNTANGTALAGSTKDYLGLTNSRIIFNNNIITITTNVTTYNHGAAGNVEKTFTVKLSNLGISANASLGISNATVRIIDPNSQGYVTLAATNFSGSLRSGVLNFIVNRTVGSFGAATVQYMTVNGTAVGGVDFVAQTNTLRWNSGDVTPQVVSILLTNSGVVGASKQFGVQLYNPTVVALGPIPNAVLTISNDNNYGTVQLTSATYLDREDAGYATITAFRNAGEAGTVSVNFTLADGTALKNVNYVPTNGVLVLGPNQTSASFNVRLLNDGVTNAGALYFSVLLSNPTNAALGTPAAAVVKLTDVGTGGWSFLPPGTPDTTSDFNSPAFNGDILSLALQPSGQILAGGNFTGVGATPVGRLTRLNTDGSFDTAFLAGLPGAGDAINSVVCQTDGRILVGGAFTTLNNANLSFIGRLMTDGTLDTSFTPGSGADNVVNALAEDFNTSGGIPTRVIYVGGAFYAFNGSPSPSLVRLYNTGSVDHGFSVGSGADGPVLAVTVYPTNSVDAGKVLVGGQFDRFNGVAINNLVRLNSDGSMDTNFNANFGAGPDAAVRALTVQAGGQVLVGGSFTNFNGTLVNHLTRLNNDGTLDTGFVAALGSGMDNLVQGILVQPDNCIVVVGEFTQANGLTRNRITRLLPTGAADLSINFGTGANGNINAIVQQPADDRLLVGGSFTEFDSQPHSHLARLNGGSTAEAGAFTFASAKFFANENALLAPITILRTGNLSGTNADGSGAVSVHVATSDGSAIAGTNYLPVSADVLFPVGEAEETVLVPVLDDFVLTTNTMTVMLNLSNPTAPVTNSMQSFAELDIANTDSSVCFSNVYNTQYKNAPGSLAPINVVRLGGINNTSTVGFFTVTNGTAVIGTDYYPTNGTLTFLPGQSLAQANVPIINNLLSQGDKTVGIELTNAVNFDLGISSPSNAILTILDQVGGLGQVYFSATNYFATSGDGTVYLPVWRTNVNLAVAGSVTLNYTLVPITAQPTVDYVAVTNGIVRIAQGAASTTIPVVLNTNSYVEGSVSLLVYLSNPTLGATLTFPTNALLTILNTNVGFSFSVGTNYVRETNGYVPIYVQRLGSPNTAAQVSYATVAGSAQPGVNFNPVSGTLAFNTNELIKTISLPLLDDPRVTGNVYLTMKLSNPSLGASFGAISNTLIVIQDADAGISFTNSAASYLKSVGVAAIPVVCTNTAVEPVLVNTNIVPMKVHYTTADGTALAGIDYQPMTGDLFFTNGIGTNYIYVPIINNSRTLGDHTFTVSLMNPTAPGQLVPPSTEAVTIVDHNSGLSFSSPVYSVLKSGVSAPITVLRTDYLTTNTTVQFSTADGTAVAGVDYIATNGMVTFTNGQTANAFAVTVLANTTVQPDKTVLLQLSNPTNGFIVAPYAATLTIHDTSGSLVVPAGSTLVHESLVTNGIIDPGETVTMDLALRASGGTNVNNLSATLQAGNGVVSPTSPNGTATQNYGNLIVEGPSAFRPFTFTASGTNGQSIIATLQLSDNVTNLGTATFTYTMGVWTNTFCNTNVILIKDLSLASPYPSGILVSNVGGVLVKSTVTLTNLSHGYTKDIEALVVSPAGADTLLMSHAGNGSVTKITLTFDDGVTNFLSNTNVLVSGTNRPTSYIPTTTFP